MHHECFFTCFFVPFPFTCSSSFAFALFYVHLRVSSTCFASCLFECSFSCVFECFVPWFFKGYFRCVFVCFCFSCAPSRLSSGATSRVSSSAFLHLLPAPLLRVNLHLLLHLLRRAPSPPSACFFRCRFVCLLFSCSSSSRLVFRFFCSFSSSFDGFVLSSTKRRRFDAVPTPAASSRNAPSCSHVAAAPASPNSPRSRPFFPPPLRPQHGVFLHGRPRRIKRGPVPRIIVRFAQRLH